MTVFLTGATGGIGSAVRDEFLSRGWNVISPTSEEMDLGEELSIAEYCQSHADVTAVTAVVNCAGINNPKPIFEFTHHDLSLIFKINAFGSLHLIRSLIGAGANVGSLVSISSLYADRNRLGRSAYSMSKAALEQLAKALGAEFGHLGVRSNIVRPGFIDTELTRRNNSEYEIEKILRNVPSSRLGLPSEVAKVVYFLSSDDASYVNGAIVNVDGGASLW